MYQPKTGAKCGCRPGVWRDNCPTCEGTGWVIDFRAIRARAITREDERNASTRFGPPQAMPTCDSEQD